MSTETEITTGGPLTLKSTVVELKVVSKKQNLNYSKEYPVQHNIELEVPYDQKSVFWKLSGGTNMVLNTINQDAADMFILGDFVVMTIEPKAIPVVEEAPVS